MMSHTEPYWVTVEVYATSAEAAENIVREHNVPRGRVINVDHAPPQGSMIVGDVHEDEL